MDFHESADHASPVLFKPQTEAFAHHSSEAAASTQAGLLEPSKTWRADRPFRFRVTTALRSRRMSQDFNWLTQGDKPEPRLERIATLWRMRGTSGRNIECAAFRTATGLELRTMYSPEEMIASQLFRGLDADEKVAEAADRWRLNLLAKGFFDAE